MIGKVFVTGATGYLARHVIRELLESGYLVVGSVRDLTREAELRAALMPSVSDPRARNRLSLKKLDLTSDAGWRQAMSGCTALLHTASPFPMTQPKDEETLLRPAVDGTRRALMAAKEAGINRVVLTSSIAAVSDCPLHEGQTLYDESNWSDVNGSNNPYSKSKTLAERAAWDFVANEGGALSLTSINPSVILGSPIGTGFGTSIGVVRRILGGRDPMVPRLGFSYCDVQDVARAHVKALSEPRSIDERIIVDSGFLWMEELAKHLKSLYPDRRIAQRVAPDVVMRLIGLFDAPVRSVLPSLGQRRDLSHDKLQRILGITPRPALDVISETADFLIENNLVD